MAKNIDLQKQVGVNINMQEGTPQSVVKNIYPSQEAASFVDSYFMPLRTSEAERIDAALRLQRFNTTQNRMIQMEDDGVLETDQQYITAEQEYFRSIDEALNSPTILQYRPLAEAITAARGEDLLQNINEAEVEEELDRRNERLIEILSEEYDILEPLFPDTTALTKRFPAEKQIDIREIEGVLAEEQIVSEYTKLKEAVTEQMSSEDEQIHEAAVIINDIQFEKISTDYIWETLAVSYGEHTSAIRHMIAPLRNVYSTVSSNEYLRQQLLQDPNFQDLENEVEKLRTTPSEETQRLLIVLHIKEALLAGQILSKSEREYWQNFEEDEPDEDVTPRIITQTESVDTTMEGTTIGTPEIGIVEMFELDLSPEKKAELLQKIKVHGAPFAVGFDGNADKYIESELKPEELLDAGLFPKYEIKVENAVVLLSMPYNVSSDSGRVAFVGYVKSGEEYVARTFYLSRSQGVWRYLPRYTPNFAPQYTQNQRVGHYDKGYTEESITLPIPLQQSLNIILVNETPLDIPGNSNYYFAGTARRKTYSADQELITYNAEVGEMPYPIEGNLQAPRAEDGSYVKLPPNEVRLAHPEKDGPDFSRIVTTWQQKTTIYGEITIEVYESKDKKLRYMFCSDTNGKSWIGGIETDEAIQSVGLRRSWVDGGDLSTPAYEYPKQIGKTEYANFNDMRSMYVDMYTNYISQIPIIQEYENSKNKQSEVIEEAAHIPVIAGSEDVLDNHEQPVVISAIDDSLPAEQKTESEEVTETPITILYP